MTKEGKTTSGMVCFNLFSVVLHCATVSCCIYLTVRLVNVQSELSAVKEEIYDIKLIEKVIKPEPKEATRPTVFVKADSGKRQNMEVCLFFL